VPPVSNTTTARLAILVVAARALAALGTFFLLQPGLPAANVTLGSQMRWVQEETAPWSIGWVCWQIAAVSLLAFYAALASRWRDHGPWRCRVALICAAVGFAADMSGQLIAMGIQPSLDSGAMFRLVERLTVVLTAYVGNTLYAGAGMLLVWAGAHVLPKRLILLSLPVWAGAGLMSVAAVIAWPFGLFLSTAIVLPAVVIWTFFMGRWFGEAGA
jgi:hypothetical protein